MAILKLSTLIAKHACAEQVDLFRATFGESVDVTPALCESMSDKFDFSWAAMKLLPPEAQAEYERVSAPAWAEYERVSAPAWAEYKRVCAEARAEYERFCAEAFGAIYVG